MKRFEQSRGSLGRLGVGKESSAGLLTDLGKKSNRDKRGSHLMSRYHPIPPHPQDAERRPLISSGKS